MIITLPSGANAPVEVPSLSALLAAGGDLAVICAATFAHDEVSPADLQEADAYVVCSWALEEFTQTEEGLELAIICDAWRRSPSQTVGITDAPLAWILDRGLFLRLASFRSSNPGGGELSGERVAFTIGEA